MTHVTQRLVAMVAIATAGVVAPAGAADEGFEAFGGFMGVANSIYGYAGGVAALNGNLGRDGVLGRVSAGIGQYTYDRAPGIGTTVGHQRGDVMVGYQKFFGPVRISAYGGLEVQNHDNYGDPNAVVRGTTAGAKGQLELFSMLGDRFYGVALGSLSSAYTSYYTYGKIGYVVMDRLSVGPEGSVHGNVRYDHGSVGGFVAYDVTRATYLSVSSGYQWDLRTPAPGFSSSYGVYGSAHLTVKF